MKKNITAEEIDIFKDNMFSRSRKMTDEQITSMENDFIDKVNLYKTEQPTDTRTVERWRKWYKATRQHLHRRYAPREVLFDISYILETFTVVKDAERGMRQLSNWYSGKVLAEGYVLNDDTVKKINDTIGRYGHNFKEISQKS